MQTLLKWTSQKFVVSAASRPPQSQKHCRIQFTGELWSFSRMEHHVLICFRFRGGIFSQTNWCEGTFFSDQCGSMLTNVEEFATIFRNRYHSLACRIAAAAATLTSYFLPILIYSSCFWQNSSCDKWAGFSQVWCHCCSPAIVRQTFRGSGNVTEDQQLSRALPRGHDEDKWRGIDNSPPLISQAHDWKDFTQVLEIFQSMREYWGVRYCSLFAPLWAVWGNLRLFVGSCPNSYRTPSVMPTSALPRALSFKSFSHHKWEASRWKTKPLRKHIMTEKLFNRPKSVILVFLC